MIRGKKIMIITDSVSMPRSEVPYEDTWIYRLKASLPDCDIMDRSARGSISRRLVTEGGGGSDLLETYMPQIVILQIGMTECAPRLFRKKGFENFIMTRIMPARFITQYVNHIKKTRGRNPDITEVSPEEYRLNLSQFAARCRKVEARLIIIKILKATPFYLSKSPGVQINIDKYNQITEDIAAESPDILVIDPASNIENTGRICLDELHINKKGHDIYYNSIIESLNRLINE